MQNKDYYIKNLHIIYEDNHLLVIEKPIDVLCQKDDTNDFDINDIVKEYLKNKYQKNGNIYLGLVHRLDRRVGGILVLAKTSKAANRLSSDIKNHQWIKQYLVKVKGKVEKDGEISLCIKKDENKRKAYVDIDGKPSTLKYRVLSYDQNDTYILVDLISGRFHQIRCSFAYINHPVINDFKYDNTLKKENNKEIGLWCYSIALLHPISKEKIIFQEMPKGIIWHNLKIKD